MKPDRPAVQTSVSLISSTAPVPRPTRLTQLFLFYTTGEVQPPDQTSAKRSEHGRHQLPGPRQTDGGRRAAHASRQTQSQPRRGIREDRIIFSPTDKSLARRYLFICSFPATKFQCQLINRTVYCLENEKRCLKYLCANNAEQMRGCFHVRRGLLTQHPTTLIYDNSVTETEKEAGGRSEAGERGRRVGLTQNRGSHGFL